MVLNLCLSETVFLVFKAAVIICSLHCLFTYNSSGLFTVDTDLLLIDFLKFFFRMILV